MRGGIVMRQSRTFIPTTREVPSSAEAISHKLLIKGDGEAGICRGFTLTYR